VSRCFADTDGERDLATEFADARLLEDLTSVGAQAPAAVDLGQ
jgi:hypothetical protein